MVLEGRGRFLQAEKSRNLIYISRGLVKDSAFPFRPGQAVKVTVDPKKKRLIIEQDG